MFGFVFEFSNCLYFSRRECLSLKGFTQKAFFDLFYISNINANADNYFNAPMASRPGTARRAP
jgi:hypothetical protein